MKKRDIHREVPRRDTIKSHLMQQHRHDPYKARHKLPSPCVCPQCDAVFLGGRWQWLDKVPEGAEKEVCPACHRSNDKYPAGEIVLSGPFFKSHRDEILSLIRNAQMDQNAEHPLSRIMDVAEKDGETVVTTTDIHLPRRVGHALEHAYKGKLDVHYNEEEYFVRVRWSRDE
jgi:hypothetical protein